MTVYVNYTYVSPYSITFVLAYVLGISISFYLMLRYNVNKTLASLMPMLTIPTSLLCSCFLSIIITGKYGFAGLGGAIGFLAPTIGLGLIFREYAYGLRTAYVKVLPLMYSVAKLGCFLVGCCFGIPYAGPFNVSYMGKVNLDHLFPVQLVEVLVFLLLFVFGLITNNNFTLCIICIVMKFSLDYLRQSHNGKVLTINQVLCIISLIMLCIYKARVSAKQVCDNLIKS